MGTGAVTSRGFKEAEMEIVGNFIDRVISDFENEEMLAEIAQEVKTLCDKFPAPGLEHLA